ncbi:enoyl-CoA hydratase/isomerase family protein [Noviherbaspirillum denitrificans]|uniref:Enoyl-CoA hydratase n=1 Tax=Noviherbaspirillum denitrificans TaxID=1968433 RepID=A0A254THE2_9BURK|nr:enoyl-CoA hydratase-related protein [Noviherbaspirillum denitrificans]OWW22059.1 enoyl-CoA hydratase [Noviherbaspirillum denitrificans]
MTYEDVIVERNEGWLEITINRPEKMNALRDKTAEEIMAVLAEAEHDRSVGAIIMKGGDKAFCTGIDTSGFEIKPNEYFDFYRKRKTVRPVNALFRTLPKYSKPVITVVEGFALGGGLELALVTDLIIAGNNAKFGLPEAKLGMMPGGGGTATLPRVIGKALAKEMMWTGRRLSAEEAREFRLVNHVTEAGKALDKARELAGAICAAAPLPVMYIKAAVDSGVDLTLADAMAAEGDASFMLYFSKDRDEGLAAFKEKRTPKFQGE